MFRVKTEIQIKKHHTKERLVEAEIIQPLKRNIMDLSILTQRVLRTSIQNASKRGTTGRLASAITVETIVNNTTEFSVGVGNINILNSVAPYWYVVNYGKRFDTGVPYIPPAFRGSFGGNAPDPSLAGAGTERAMKDGLFSIKPKKPIRPLRYIETGLNWYFTNVSLYLNKK